MFGFRLTQEFRTTGFSGGSVNCTPLGHAFDVGAAIKAGDGVIATEDEVLAAVLRSYPALEEVSEGEIPEGVSASIMPGREDLSALTIGPPTLQSGIRPTEWMETPPGAGEVAAEHADPASTPQGEIQAGEAVSGTTSANQPDSEASPDQDATPDQSGDKESSQSPSSPRFSR